MKKFPFCCVRCFTCKKIFRTLQQKLRSKKRKNDFGKRRLFKDIQLLKHATWQIAFTCWSGTSLSRKKKFLRYWHEKNFLFAREHCFTRKKKFSDHCDKNYDLKNEKTISPRDAYSRIYSFWNAPPGWLRSNAVWVFYSWG